jgi:hypothetical protein
MLANNGKQKGEQIKERLALSSVVSALMLICTDVNLEKMLRSIILQKIVQPKQSEFTIVFTVF